MLKHCKGRCEDSMINHCKGRCEDSMLKHSVSDDARIQ